MPPKPAAEKKKRKTVAQQLAEMAEKMAALQARQAKLEANPPKSKAPKAQDKFKEPIKDYVALLEDGDKFYINFPVKKGDETVDNYAKLLEVPDQDDNLLFLVQTTDGACS